MKTSTVLGICAVLGFSLPASAAGAARTAGRNVKPVMSGTLQVTADRIAADRASEALVASGHVVAVSTPYRLESAGLLKAPDKIAVFENPTTFTTCTNAPGERHWMLSGSVEYNDGRYGILRDGWLRFWEVPVLWLPFWYHPIDGVSGLRVMPGYTGRWGAYILTKYVYHIAGDPTYAEGSAYLTGNTRFDLRYKNGIALGQTLGWQLGDFGRGKFKVYYAWDQDDHYENDWNSRDYNWRNWGSSVPDERYGIELSHVWDVTERDKLRLSGAYYSDSYFRSDFFRKSFFGIKNQYVGSDGNEVAWEHVERAFGTGVSAAGPLNDFYEGTMRLPEWYLDVAPQPIWILPVNYESSTRAGYLLRQPARYGDGQTETAFSCNPGVWADYNTFRFDTYHRLTAPFRLFDVLSVVPRVGYHGTYWNDGGNTVPDGLSRAGQTGDGIFRSILEGGITFAGRGTAWLSETWQHMIEPYADVLAQKAWYSGLRDGNRPYVFDSIDASTDWFDQFAGRSRNLPYTWYGVTPGIRNAFREAGEDGKVRTVFDFDVYSALQFSKSDWATDGEYHRLAEVGKPNYGEDNLTAVPGARVRWFPDDDTMLLGRIEYDCENDVIAMSELAWRQRLNARFSYYASYMSGNYRWWDFSSSPTAHYVRDGRTYTSEDFNMVHFGTATVGFEHEICDALAWSPFVRWDCREGELDEVGAWFDIRTDCLGFRLIVSYEKSYTRIDGSEYHSDCSVGFYVYLRAFGPSSGSLLGGD